jgi:hypothetical protein
VKDAELTNRDAASSFLRNALVDIPTLVGQLVYIVSLRDPNTGRYRHHGMVQMFGEERTDQALRAGHSAAFCEWLCLDLEQQQADLELYFAGQETDRRTVVSTWQALEPYRHLIPAGVDEPERRLFLTDLATLLGLLRKKYRGARPEPGV